MRSESPDVFQQTDRSSVGVPSETWAGVSSLVLCRHPKALAGRLPRISLPNTWEASGAKGGHTCALLCWSDN